MAIPSGRCLAGSTASSAAGFALAPSAVSGFAGAATGLVGFELLEHQAEACMSQSASVVAELQSLRLELAALSARVLALEAKLEEPSFSSAAAAPVTFNLTQQSSVPGGYSEVASSTNSLPVVASPTQSGPPAGTSVRGSVEQTEQERRER